MAKVDTFPFFIFVLGTPGAGKGTLCKKLADHEGFYHFSVGDYFREQISNQSPLSSKIWTYMRGERLIRESTLKEIFNEDVLPMLRAKNRPCILIDGFPKHVSQIPVWEEKMPQLVLFFDCPKHIAAVRFIQRARGSSNTDQAALFETRHSLFAMSKHKVLEHYTTMQDGLSSGSKKEDPKVVAAKAKNLGMVVTVDTSKSTEESWQNLQSELENSSRWESMMTTIAREFEPMGEAGKQKVD